MNEGPRKAPPRPTILEDFLASLLKSQLVDTRMLFDAMDAIQLRQRPQGGRARLCEYFIARGSLTEWQCDKLKCGKYTGFYVGQFRLLDRQSESCYLAEDRVTHQRVTLEVRLNSPGPGRIEFKVTGASDWIPISENPNSV